MKIRMLRSCKGTEDGFIVRQFYAGEIYDLREGLARMLIRTGMAVKIL